MLIMVSRNHTSRTFPTEPFWLDDAVRLPKDPQRSKRFAYLMKLAGTSLAIHVIQNLLKHSRDCIGEKAVDGQPGPGAWPLSPTQVDGLYAALYFLRRHGEDMLMAERDR
jgi:hypothetical protein